LGRSWNSQGVFKGSHTRAWSGGFKLAFEGDYLSSSMAKKVVTYILPWRIGMGSGIHMDVRWPRNTYICPMSSQVLRRLRYGIKVEQHLDYTFQGGLIVWLLRMALILYWGGEEARFRGSPPGGL